MLICTGFNGLEWGQVRDSVPFLNRTKAFSPVLCLGSVGVGKSCFLCCSRRRRLSSSSCWAALVTASNWCSRSSFLKQATHNNHAENCGLAGATPIYIISSAFLMKHPSFPAIATTHTSCRRSCTSTSCYLPNKL